MNVVNGPAHQESLVAQWLERPTGIWEAKGLNPACRGLLFFLCPTLVTNEHLHRTKITDLDQTVVFAFAYVFPCALFPVLIRHRTESPSLSTHPVLAARTLNTRFSLWSLQSWRSHMSSHSRDSLISVTTITSIPPGYPWGTRLAMCTRLTCAAVGR